MPIHDPALLDAIGRLGSERLESITVWRHMFNDNPPELSNIRGARWNPPGVAAIYTSEQRETAIAEANGDIRITVSGRPRPGNWIKAPNARSYVLIYTVAAEGGMVTGSPRDVPLFSIKQGGC